MPIDSGFLNNLGIGGGGGGEQGGGGGGQQGGGQQQQPSGGFSWQQFLDYRNQVAQANQQQAQQPWAPQQEQEQSWVGNRSQDQPRYREMTQLERFAKGAQEASAWLGSAAGNALFGEAQPGENPYEIKLENAPRFLANLPGMIVGSVPDIAGYGGELLANAPVQEADSQTGLIENRALTNEERMGDVGYTGLAILGMLPGVGLEARAGGLAMKAGSAGARAVGKQGAAEALSKVGSAGIKGETGAGLIERIGSAAGKEGKDLNPYRWGDAALETAKTTTFEGLQEAGQTYFEDMRQGQLDEHTGERMLQGGFWGALGGGVFGGGTSVGNTAITNSRANRGLDRNGNPVTVDQQQRQPNESYFKFYNNDPDANNWSILPEVQQRLLEREGDQDAMYRSGMSSKGIPGQRGQNPLMVNIGARSIRAEWEADATGQTRSYLASWFGKTEDEFADLMRQSDAAIANELDGIMRQKNASGDPTNYMYVSSSRAPSTQEDSTMTFIAGGVTPGNTVSYAPGVPSMTGGDLDGDIYSIHTDPGMVDWSRLPTRKLMTAKDLPAKNSKADNPTLQGYGNVAFGFEQAGITELAGDKDVNSQLRTAVMDTFIDHGVTNQNRLNYWMRRFDNAFKLSKEEKDAGISWEQKLSRMLMDITEDPALEQNNPLAGDMLAADIITTLSEECAPLFTIKRAVDAYGTNDNVVGDSIKSTMENMPRNRGAMPDGKTAITQMMQWWGRVDYALSQKESPMFRFKQMGAWNEKFVPMLRDFCNAMNIHEVNDVDAMVKWSMQMVNDLHLPIDYVETAFKAKVLNEAIIQLGIDGTSTSNKFGHGLTLENFRAAVTESWNRNAELYEQAMSKYLTSEGQEQLQSSAIKTRIDPNESGSFYRAAMDLFGSWDIGQLFWLDDTSTLKGKSLAAAVEERASNPYNYDRSMFAYDDDANTAFNGFLDDYQGRQAAQISSLKHHIEKAVKDSKVKFTFDKEGHATWDSEHNLEVSYLTGVYANTVGMDAAMYLGIPGTRHLANSGWARYLLSNDPDTVNRCLVAMGVRYNFREYIAAKEAGNLNAEAALSSVDFSNPLNKWILDRMIIEGKRETGIDGALSDSPLRTITDPSKGSYGELSILFEENGKTHVRRKSDMLLYYALDDGKSAVGASQLTTRTRTVKNYQNAISGNTIAKARIYVNKVKALTGADSMIPQKRIVQAIKDIATSYPNTVDVKGYAAGLHDAAYMSGDAAEKAKAGRGVSLHAQAVAYIDGGYTASFLDQLGYSVGAVSQSVQYKISDAIRRAIFDPEYSQDIIVNDDGSYVTISQARIFATVGRTIDKDSGVQYADLMALFDKHPQLLCQLMPQVLQPLSADADTVTAMMAKEPSEAIREYSTRYNKDESYIRSLQETKVKNALLNDQDSTLLTIGSIDSRYDDLIADTGKWSQAIEDSARDWSKFLYRLACIDDDNVRSQVINRNFGVAKSAALRRTRSLIDTLKTATRQKAERMVSKSLSQEAMDNLRISQADRIKAKYMEEEAVDVIIPSQHAELNKIKASVKQNMASIEKAIDADFTLLEYGLSINSGKDLGYINGRLSSQYIDQARSDLMTVMEDGKRKYTDEQIDRIIEEMNDAIGVDRAAVEAASKVLINEDDIDFSKSDLSPDSMISKVRAYVDGGNYKRLKSEYGNMDEWEKDIRQAYADLKSDKPAKVNSAMRTIEQASRYWNQEIMHSKLQSIEDLYGAGTPADAFKRLDEAKVFVESLVDEIRADKTIQHYGAYDPDNLNMPYLSYNNKATSWHIELASIELETGHAPISSGQNAGSYQYLGVLDFVGKNYRCPVEPRTGLTREQALEFAREQASPLNILNADGSISSISESDLMDPLRFPDEMIAQFRFAPQRDCTDGICELHNPQSLTNTGGDYLGGRYTIASLCWFLSEKRVFKSKKKRHVFDKIAHTVKQSETLKKQSFDGRDRQTLLAEVQEYQEKLAKHINEVFIAEKMNDEFGIDDARIVAQFMTPMIEFTYTDETGALQRMTISKHALANDDHFLKAIGDIDMASVENVRPVAMSLLDVCRKLSDDFIRELGDKTQAGEGRLPAVNELNAIFGKSLDNWGGKALGSDGLTNFLHSMPVVRRSTRGSVLYGSSPNAMQNFLDLSGSPQRGDIRNIKTLIANAPTLSIRDKTVIEESNDQINIFLNIPNANGRQPVIVKSYITDFYNGVGKSFMKMRNELSLLNTVDKSALIPNALNCAILPDITSANERVYSAFNDAQVNNRLLLVPMDSANVFEQAIGDEAFNARMDGKAIINDIKFAVYDPFGQYNSEIDTAAPTSYMNGFYPEEVSLTFEDVGILGTDDSGFKLNPAYQDEKMHFQQTDEYNRDVLSGKGAMKKTLSGLTPFTLEMDQNVREDIAVEMEKARNGESSRFVIPDFDKTYQVKDDVIFANVDRYLKRKDSELSPNGIVNTPVGSGDCMGFVAVRNGGMVYYMPLMFMTGGKTMRLNSVYLSDTSLREGRIELFWNGDISFQEAEGLKLIFPTVAFKSYGTLMTPAEERAMLHPGFTLMTSDPRNGQQRALDTKGQYSGTTEDNRLIDAGYITKVETLGNLGKIYPRHYFMKQVGRNWEYDYNRFAKLGMTAKDVEDICNYNNRGIWERFVAGEFDLHEDAEVNTAMRKVAQAALSCLPKEYSPLYAFANIHNGKIMYVNFNEQLIYSCLTDNELERFFHAMDPNLCFDGVNDMPSADRQGPTPYVNHDGMILGSDSMYHKGHVHFLHPTDDSSMLGQPSHRIKYGSQQVMNMGLIYGLRQARDMQIVNDYINARGGNVRAYTIGGKNVDNFFDGRKQEDIDRLMAETRANGELEAKYLENAGLYSPRSIERARKIQLEERRNMQERIDLRNDDKTEVVDLNGTSADAEMYRMSIARFRNALGMDIPFSEIEIHQLFKQTTASTYNNGRGNRTITVKHFCAWLDDVSDNIQHGRFPFESEMTITGRPIIPYITSSLVDRLMTSSKIANANGQVWTREMFVEKMEDELDKTLDMLQFSDTAQRESVYTMIDYIGGTYGKPWMSRPLGDMGVHLADAIDTAATLTDALGREEGYAGLEEKRKQSRDMIKQAIRLEARRKHSKVPTESVKPGFITRKRVDKNNELIGDAASSISATSRIMATMNPALPISSVLLRFKAQGLMKGYLFLNKLDRNGTIRNVTPGVELRNREAVKAAAADPRNQEIWRAFNVLSWSGQDILELQNVNSYEDFQNLMEKRMANMTWFEKQQNKMFNIVSGGRFGVPWQIENFLDRFAATTTEENSPWLTEVVGPNGQTRLEQFVEQAPDNLLMDLLTMKNENPDFMRANQARNFVLKNEHAAQSVFGLVLSDLFSRHPVGEAMFITGFCRFPHYAYNVGGWFVNHVAPVSTAAYIVRDLLIKASKNGDGKIATYLDSLGLERTQTMTNLREAIVMDSMMMGSTMLACALFGIGAFEPPDDEYYDEYAGNPGEWTIAGFRIKENWWLMDILGPFAAVCATWKSIQIGKPRLDILQNWMTQALWSNPVMKASDVARSMLDPTESYLEDYENVVNQYQKAEGGAPDLSEAWLDDQVSFGLNWFGQFITPSIVREIGNSREFLEYERSYKKIENEDGELEYTDYLDSQIRKVTRRNPMLGLVLDTANGIFHFNDSESGYIATEMPEVKIPDQNQLGSMQYFGMTWADGTEKSDAEKMATAYEALAWLSSTDDMDALYQQGFCLPMETRIYMSQMLNDMRQYEQDQYNAWVQETGTDAYYVGNGDFAEGKRIINEVQSAFYDDLRDINKLFDKVWSDEMSRGLQMYYREATTYARTASGEYYATGVRQSIIPWPIQGAPGTYNAPLGIGTRDDGTMGRSGNWETESVVVPGASAGSRALVPIDPEYIKHPKLEDFASEDNDGYSDTPAGKAIAEANKNGANNKNTTTASKSGYPRGGYGGRSYGGGGYRRYGGGGGRGGGSGSGYTPNAYAPTVGLSKVNASRIMNTDKLINPNEAYLRPDFETKGSREAYKRSDI